MAVICILLYTSWAKMAHLDDQAQAEDSSTTYLEAIGLEKNM